MSNYVYYTAQINNDASKSSTNYNNEEPFLEFKEDRKVPIIEKTDEYEMAVESAMFDLKTLPIFIPTIKYNNNRTDLQKTETIYEITLEFNGYSATTPIYFTPQDETNTLPKFVDGMPYYKSGYYNLYNYEFFFTMVNEAIRNAMLKLIETVTHYNGGTLPTTFSNLSNSSGLYEIPYFIFDKDGGLIYLNSPKSTFSDSNSNHVNIMLNRALYRLFNSLPFKLVNKTFNTLDDNNIQTTTTKTLHKLNFSNFKNANEVEIYPHLSIDTSGLTKTTHMLIYQDYSTLSSWSPVESIVLISPNFPIPSHQMSASLEYLDGMISQLGNERTEQEILEVESHNPVPYLLYEQKQFRWMHLNQSDSDNMRQILFKVFYRFKLNGELIPVKSGVGGSFSVKLMFRKIR